MIFIGIIYYLINCIFPPINKWSYNENKLLIKPNGGIGAAFELIDCGNNCNWIINKRSGFNEKYGEKVWLTL